MTTGATSFLDTLLAERPAGGVDGIDSSRAVVAGATGAQGPARSLPLAWFEQLRAEALERANALAVPTTRDEEWRFTDLAPLTRLSFQPVHAAPSYDEAALQQRFVPEAYARLVFIDGVWMPQLSQLPASGAGISVLDLRTALSERGVELERHLGKLATFDANVFTALNTAYLRQGAVIVLDAGRALPGAVHVLHLVTRRERAHAIYPRTLLVAGRNSTATLIEDFTAADDAAYFSAPVTEMALDANAAVSHIRLQREGAQAFHLGTCAVWQGSGSNYRGINVAFGARLSRLELSVVHGATGCETTIDGLALISQRQLADTHSFVDHAHPDGRLRQVHKCVASGAAHAVFNGKILVREGAQRTDAGQSLRGLLLSERAHIDAKPQLEIFADDVKCAHGAAIGQLDPEELFYLRTRGLTEERAHNLLTYAFAAEVIERIAVPSLKSQLTRTVLERTQEMA